MRKTVSCSSNPICRPPRAEAATMLVQVYERYVSTVSWLHGFYAISSYSQIGLTDAMDAVSLGWGPGWSTPPTAAPL